MVFKVILYFIFIVEGLGLSDMVNEDDVIREQIDDDNSGMEIVKYKKQQVLLMMRKEFIRK